MFDKLLKFAVKNIIKKLNPIYSLETLLELGLNESSGFNTNILDERTKGHLPGPPKKSWSTLEISY